MPKNEEKNAETGSVTDMTCNEQPSLSCGSSNSRSLGSIYFKPSADLHITSQDISVMIRDKDETNVAGTQFGLENSLFCAPGKNYKQEENEENQNCNSAQNCFEFPFDMPMDTEDYRNNLFAPKHAQEHTKCGNFF